MNDAVVLLAFVALNLAVAFAGFCRISHMDALTTKPLIRHIYVLVPIGALVSVFAALFWGFAPSWPSLIPVANLGLLLFISRDRWTKGVPAEYQR